MSDIVNLSRRRFLEASALAGGGLVLGVRVTLRDATAQAADGAAKIIPCNAFVHIGTDDLVHVVVNHSEMGQGPYTSGPMLVAEEIEADWSKVRYLPAPVDPAYNHSVYGIQMTGGSSSTWSEWDRVRKAGAAAKVMLIAAAAEAWKVEPATCRAEKNHVIHDASGRRTSFGDLAESAAQQTPPQDPPLKDSKNYKIIGKPTHRLDTPDKTNGKAVFGLDVQVPGMLVALVARSPVFGGKVRRFNADQAKVVPGVRHVVEIERGVAVVADGFWAAKRGREALEVTWDEGPLAALDTNKQGDEYAALAGKPGVVAARRATSRPRSVQLKRKSRPSTTCPTWRMPRWSR